MGIARGLVTLTLLLTFVAMIAWLWNSRNKHRFDAAAQLPLEDDHAELQVVRARATRDTRG